MENSLDEEVYHRSVQLKMEVSEYELESLAGFFSYFIRYRPEDVEELDQYESKLKDFMYLIALNATARKRGDKKLKAGDPVISKWAKDLKKIKDLYRKRSLGDIDQWEKSEDNRKKLIHYLSFHTYFENGILSFVEQDLDRLHRIFSKFESYIKSEFSFDVDFLTTLYRFSEYVNAEKHKKANAFASTPEFREFMQSEKAVDLERRLDNLPDEIFNQLFDYMECSHIAFKFTKEEYASAFPKEQIESFLDLFTFQPEPLDSYLFFTQPNPLEEKPILKLESGEYLHVYQKQLPFAVGRFFYQHLQNDKTIGDKLRKHRDKALEAKTEEIFRKFFGGEERTYFYTNYHVAPNTEQDILILSKNAAFIVEVKASKYREPFRDPVKGYTRLQSDFADSVQYGFNQCLRVEEKFWSGRPFIIFDESGKRVYEVNSNKYIDIFSIVVTLERFGPIQSALDLMLQKEDHIDFPWSVYIDDLETFLLGLKRTYNNPIPAFKSFLRQRRTLHGRSFVTDELDVCGTFLSNRELFKELSENEDASATFLPENQEIFDDLYRRGLGFQDELFWDNKRNREPVKIAKIKGWRFPL